MNNLDQIFISYAREDEATALELKNKLRGAGFNTWMDKECILPGQNWDFEIRKAIKKSRIMIILFSNNSVRKRGYIQREFKLALDVLEEIPEDEVFVIPVRLNNCQIPQSFKKFQYCKIDDINGYNKLLSAIKFQIQIIDEKDSFIDERDGEIYRTINFNGKVWLADNFRFQVEDSIEYKESNPIHAGNESIVRKKLGRIYSWDTAMNIVPSGWALPSLSDWRELEEKIGGIYVNGKLDDIAREIVYDYFIEGGPSQLNIPKHGLTSSTDYVLDPYGIEFWTSSEYDDEPNYGAQTYFFSLGKEVGRMGKLKEELHHVRLIKKN